MPSSERPTRAQRRHLGKREANRQARHDLARVIELADRGLSPAAIASSVGLEEGAVREILEGLRGLRGEGGLLE